MHTGKLTSIRFVSVRIRNICIYIQCMLQFQVQTSDQCDSKASMSTLLSIDGQQFHHLSRSRTLCRPSGCTRQSCYDSSSLGTAGGWCTIAAALGGLNIVKCIAKQVIALD